MNLDPLKVPSLKEACIRRLEELILSGALQPGEKLPPERELAAQLSISRPVVHEALVDLAAKGLVQITPRHGVRICDFRTHGSMAILSSLLDYHGHFDPSLTRSMIEMRLMLESETARLAAQRRSSADLLALDQILRRELQLQGTAPCDPAALTELDFEFHLQIALSSGNSIYPLIINSFKTIYTALTRQFFDNTSGTPAVDEVLAYHQALLQAILNQTPAQAESVMREMLLHGERLLERVKGDQ